MKGKNQAKKMIPFFHFCLVPLKVTELTYHMEEMEGQSHFKTIPLMFYQRYDPPGHERLKWASQHRFRLVDQRQNPENSALH